MIRYEDFVADVAALRRQRWAKILAAEPPGRRPGRRPRDPQQEELLARLDRRRLARLEATSGSLVPPAIAKRETE